MKIPSLRSRRSQWLVSAVLAAMPAVWFAAPASAQQQLNQNGTALDANNRIGSGGVNTYRPPPQVGVMGNNIINGNVTLGREFHGNVPYTDPNEFGGFQAGRLITDFTKNSVGTGTPYAPPTMPNVSTAYFGASRFAPPPPGQGQFVMTPNSGGAFVPATPTIVQNNDQRMGAQLDALNPDANLPKMGELVLPGPVDASGNQAVYTASPLTGVRQWTPGQTMDFSNPFLRVNGTNQDNVLNANSLGKMQQELHLAANPNLASANLSTNGPEAQNATANPSALSQGPLQTLESPVNAPLGAGQLNSALVNGPINGNLQTQQTYYDRVLGTPQQQSKQYDELKKRLERYEGEHPNATQQNVEEFNKAMRDKQAAAAAAQQNKLTNPAVPQPPGAPGATGKNKPAKEPAPLTPLPIQTMTEGVQGKGLKELLGNAESLMKQGKYTSAIDAYGAAETVAPNQPLIWIGRANAELGAAYYNRAEAHLKQAFATDKALLMGQYDLRTFLGEDRLQSIIKDLKEIANSDPNSSTPLFLLAYISYNTGNESRAAGWIDLADKRSGGKDPVYKLLREHWALPTSNPTTPQSSGSESISK